MAATATPHPIPSLRSMRDTYVNLLLSSGQQPADPPPPLTPRPNWTPGQSLGAPQKDHAVHWASPVTPVTPVLTENEMRVAEVAANLVAAGDAEKRNKDAIRALADKLEQSEQRNRELEAAVRTEGKKKREKRRMSYGEARRNIHFTPRTPRRSGGQDIGSERRRSRKVERESFHEYPFHLELDSLRMEKKQWLQEREKFSSMMSDIKKNTSRLLDERQKLRHQCGTFVEERDSHLQVIARLQSELLEMKQREAFHERRNPDSNPLPRRDQPIHQHHDMGEMGAQERVTMYHQSSLRNLSPRTSGDRHDENRDSNQGKGLTPASRESTSISVEDDICRVQDEFGREEELQTELHLVNQENVRVTEHNTTLLRENAELKEQLILLEKRQAELRAKLQDRQQYLPSGNDGRKGDITKAVLASSSITSNTQLKRLLDEINLLESVAYAIHFEMSPSEADRVQETLTDVGSFTSDHESSKSSAPKKRVRTSSTRDQQEGIANEHPVDTITCIVHRLAAVRTDICSKYGKWLEAVANDMSSTGIETIETFVDRGRETRLDISSEGMNTKIINELVGS